MTRPLTIALVLIGFLLCVPKKSSAQIFSPPIFYPRFPDPPVFHPPSDPVGSPVEVGGHLAAGGGSEAASGANGNYVVGIAGVYGQWNRYGLCPGLDLRIQGNTQFIHGYLVGPRVAYQPRGRLNPFRFYAEALFGKNEIPTGNNATVTSGDVTFSGPTFSSQSGVMRAGVIGLDIHSDSAFSWRVIEFTKGDFTGLAGSHPQTITTGIVLHLP